jgi:cytochrome P450
MTITPPTTRALTDLPEWRPGVPFVGTTLAVLRSPIDAPIEAYRHFGPVFRTRFTGGRHLVMAGPEANDFIWSHSELWDYGSVGAIFREQFSDRYLTQLDGEEHKHKRRRMAIGFRVRSVAQSLPLQAEVLGDAIAGLPHGRCDLREFCKALIVRMGAAAMVNWTPPPGFDHDVAALEHDLLLGGAFGPLRHLWYRRPGYVRRKRRLMQLLEPLVEARLADPTGDDVLSLMIRHVGDDEPMPDVEEWSHDLLTLFQAGSETTAHVLLWSLLFCLSNPRWIEELDEELVRWDSSAPVTDFPKLQATVLETERLRPPFAIFVRHARESFEFEGLTVPAGTRILHLSTVGHFLQEVHDDPYSFKPARFVGEMAPSTSVRWEGTFGGGTHICLGLPLARAQEIMFLAEVLKNYGVALDEMPSLRCGRGGFVVSPVERHLPATFRRRTSTP